MVAFYLRIYVSKITCPSGSRELSEGQGKMMHGVRKDKSSESSQSGWEIRDRCLKSRQKPGPLLPVARRPKSRQEQRGVLEQCIFPVGLEIQMLCLWSLTS